MSASVTRQRIVNVNLLEYANKNRDEGFFSDVTIVTGNERIPANRLVLSCYSTYLEGMFKFQERNFTKENIIEIETVHGITLKALIDFIYTGSITINEQSVKDLLSGAHYLKLDDVKQFCFEFLQSHITADNALDILKAAIFITKTETFKMKFSNSSAPILTKFCELKVSNNFQMKKSFHAFQIWIVAKPRNLRSFKL